MSYGYSQQLVSANRRASKKSPGVLLGRVCIAADCPVSEIAGRIGVSRTTVYNWFTGLCIPAAKHTVLIDELIQELNRSK